MGGARHRPVAALTTTSVRPAKPARPILTGLLGGSFNPAHGGHLAISQQAMAALGLDALWWLVSPGNPLKAASDMAPLAARLAAAAAVARGTGVTATAIEAELGTRYTIDTLRALIRRFPRRRFIWVMGADNLATFDRWRDWQDVARLLPIAVVARPGYDAAAAEGEAAAWLRRNFRPADQSSSWPEWSLPALVSLEFAPDLRSASAIRAGDPRWFDRLAGTSVRDPLTRRLHHVDPLPTPPSKDCT